MTLDVMRDGKVVPLRVVPPPSVLDGREGVMPVAKGATSKAALLEPLSMRERVMTCAIADALQALRGRAEIEVLEDPALAAVMFDPAEKQGLLGLLVAFEDATGCKWVDAKWR